MIQIKASIGNEPYRIEIESETGNGIIADEPIEKGGQNKGFSPKELLASSLAACTCATVRMYANRKDWQLQIQVTIDLIEEDGKTIFKRHLQFEGNLDDKQRTRLLQVANACPIHKILTHSIEINTQLV